MEGEKTAVRLKNVTVIRDDAEIIKGVDLEFPAGATTVIMGPSGCGKSVLLKIAAGIVPPERGTVFLSEKDVKKISDKELNLLRKSHGFIFQDAALWANKSVYQNLSLPLEFHFRHLSPGEIKRRISETLRIVGYKDRETLRPSQLSSGERKMVAFGRAIITDPWLIFMDEPTMSVDHEVAEKLVSIIKRLREERRTLIISTNDPVLTSMVADFLVVMKLGEVLETGPFDRVIRSKNREVVSILSDVLSQTSSYSGDILDLLNPD